MRHSMSFDSAVRATRRSYAQSRTIALTVVSVFVLVWLLIISAQQVAHAAPNVRVRVIIERLEALDNIDNLSSADFYSRVSINGEEFPRQGPIDNEDIILPNWAFTKDVDFAVTPSVPVSIEIWDSDSFFNGSDNRVDVNPGSGKTLNLNINLGGCSIGGDVSGICQDTITVRGTDNDRAEMQFRIEIEFPFTPGLKIKCLHDPIWPQATDTVTFTASTFDDSFTAKFANSIELWINNPATPAQTGVFTTGISAVQGPFLAGQTVTYGCLARSGSDVAWSGWKTLQVGQPITGRAIPIMYTGPREDRIDIVFSPDISTTQYALGATDPAFLADVRREIADAYFAEDVFLRNQEKLNFWIAEDAGVLVDSRNITVPNGWNTDYSFADAGALLQRRGIRDFAPRGARIFSSDVNRLDGGRFGRVTVHETGHSPFGLADEYCCDGGYFQSEEWPNVYKNDLIGCQKDPAATDSDNCQIITTTLDTPPVTYYRLDRGLTVNDDLMTKNLTPQQADVRRIQWLFDQIYAPGVEQSLQGAFSLAGGPQDPFPRLDLNDQTKTLNVALEFDGMSQVGLSAAQLFTGKPPTHLGNPPLLRIRLYNREKQILEEFNEWNPLWTFSYGEDGREHMIVTPRGVGNFAVPFLPASKTMEVFDIPTQKQLASVDLKPTINSYCDSSFNDPDCATDLALAVSQPSPQIVAGTKLTYTLNIANIGLIAASGVVVTQTLPSGVVYDS